MKRIAILTNRYNLFLLMLLLLAVPTVAQAADISVTTADDTIAADRACSLREAIENANSNPAVHADCAAGDAAPAVDRITFVGLGTPTIQLTGGALPIVVEPLSVVGPATIDGLTRQRIFNIDGWFATVTSPLAVDLQSLTLINGRDHVGGAIYAYNQVNLTISDSVFSNNEVPNAFEDARGGAIYVRDEVTLNVLNSQFNNNRAHEGGAISVAGDSTLTVNDSTFRENSAFYGGAIDVNTPNVSVIDSIFLENRAAYYGAAIDALYGDLSTTNNSFTNNSAQHFGGAVDAVGSEMSSNLNLFSGNQSGGDGGAISTASGTTLVSDNDTYDSNRAAVDGGAIANLGYHTLTVYRGEFRDNRANDDGGAIYNAAGGGTVDLQIETDTQFIRNIASDSGGAIYTVATGDSALTGVFRNTLTLAPNTQLTENRAGTGGALYLDYGTLTVMQSTFGANQAESQDPNSGGGGAIYSDHAALNITNSRFTDNSAVQAGGALAARNSVVTSSSNQFRNNASTGSQGGAISCRTDGLNSSLTNVTVRENTFEANRAGQNGGALDLRQCSWQVTTSTLAANRAGGDGGAIANNDSRGTMVNSTLSGNQAANGGAIATVGTGNSGAGLTVRSSTIAGNSATGLGGGVYHTLSGSVSPTTAFANTILAGNEDGQAAVDANDCFASPVNILTSLGYNLLGRGTFVTCEFNQSTDLTVASDQVFSQILDPLLRDNGGPTLTHALVGNQPQDTLTSLDPIRNNLAIDNGDVAGCLVDSNGIPLPPTAQVDQRGIQRPGRCDIGAVEAIFFKVVRARSVGTEQAADRTVTSRLFAGNPDNKVAWPNVVATFYTIRGPSGALIPPTPAAPQTTDPNGEITFVYLSQAPAQVTSAGVTADDAVAAVDTIEIWADLNSNGVRDGSDPSDLRTFTASVPLLRFSATVNGDGTVTLSWQTGPTSNIVGFNLLRSASPDADYAPVNETLITGDCAAVGGCQYQDTPPGVGPYYYKLQQIDSAGSAEDLDGGNMVIVWMNQVHQSYLPLIQR